MDPGPIDGASIAARYAAVEHVEPIRHKLKSTGENELGQHTDSHLRKGVSRHAGHSNQREGSSDGSDEDVDGLDVLVDGSDAQTGESDGGPHLDVMA